MDCLCSAEFQPSARCALRTSLLPRQLQKKVRRGHGIHGLGIPEMNARTAILQHGEDNEATKLKLTKEDNYENLKLKHGSCHDV